MTEESAAVEETPVSEDDSLLEAYRSITKEGIEDEPADEPEAEADVEEVTEVAEEAEETEEKPLADAIKAPTDLPAALRDQWANIPEAARDAILSSQRDMAGKLAEQGRTVHAVKPIYDVVLRAAQEIPTLKDMTPAQIAEDVFKMATIQGQLAKDPVGTILGVAQQYGALDGLREKLGGTEPGQASQQNMALVQEVRQLRAQLAKATDPSGIDERINRTFAARDTERAVTEFATSQEHWGAVEREMPGFIGIAQQRLGEGASIPDILNAAYDMAIYANPDLRAKVTAAAQAPAEHDPKRTEAARKAKSVNVTSTSAGKPREMSEEDSLRATYRKAVAS